MPDRVRHDDGAIVETLLLRHPGLEPGSSSTDPEFVDGLRQSSVVLDMGIKQARHGGEEVPAINAGSGRKTPYFSAPV